MSKGILVMDIPNTCGECPIGHEDSLWQSVYCPITLSDARSKKRSEKCPLREVEKRIFNNLLDEYSDGYDDGWNDCIDEILKGSEVG